MNKIKIHIIEKDNFLDFDLSKLKPAKVLNEFWADPFLFKYKDEYYVFLENYSYQTGFGRIFCGKVKNNKLVEIVDALNLDYLPYTYIFKEDGSNL